MNYYKFILYTIVCSLIIGCSKEDYSDDIIFKLQVSEVGTYSVMTTVTHNATNRDSYYCFAIEGVVTDIQSEITKHLSLATPSQLEKEVHSQRKSVFRFTRLFPEKTYTLIVFGMNSDKQLYGKPDAVVFTTLKSDMVANENPKWKIYYKGHTIRNDIDFSLITVYVLGEIEERYFLAVIPEADADAFQSEEEFIVHSTFDFLDKTDENTDYWLEDDEVRTAGTNFYRYLQPGNYIFYAIGIDADGYPTGHYVKTPICTVEKYPLVETYANLLGNWIIRGNKQKYLVTFSEGIVNKTLYLSGWGNSQEYSIYTYFDRNDGSLTINSQLVSKEAEIHFNDGDVYNGRLYLLGAYYNSEGELKKCGYTEQLTLTKATLDEDGNYTFRSKFYVTMDDGSKNTETGMMYYIEQTILDWAMFDLMMFPFTMTKK